MTEIINGTMIVGELAAMQHLAANFRQNRELELQLLMDDPDAGGLPDRIRRLNNKGLILRKFQQQILDTVNTYHSIFDDDDVVEAVINGRVDDTMSLVIDLYTQFDKAHPHLELLSIVPVDMEGTTGFVVRRKA